MSLLIELEIDLSSRLIDDRSNLFQGMLLRK